MDVGEWCGRAPRLLESVMAALLKVSARRINKFRRKGGADSSPSEDSVPRAGVDRGYLAANPRDNGCVPTMRNGQHRYSNCSISRFETFFLFIASTISYSHCSDSTIDQIHVEYAIERSPKTAHFPTPRDIVYLLQRYN